MLAKLLHSRNKITAFNLLNKVKNIPTAFTLIAKTGKTGLALGDHLHFGMVIQGIEVRPIEWFDGKWIKKFIDNVFKEADNIITPPAVKKTDSES